LPQVALETSGSSLADGAGINGVVFGATVLAAASALPEISTGIEAVRLGDHELAIVMTVRHDVMASKGHSDRCLRARPWTSRA
jgi:hypothetical protein